MIENREMLKMFTYRLNYLNVGQDEEDYVFCLHFELVVEHIYLKTTETRLFIERLIKFSVYT